MTRRVHWRFITHRASVALLASEIGIVSRRSMEYQVCTQSIFPDPPIGPVHAPQQWPSALASPSVRSRLRHVPAATIRGLLKRVQLGLPAERTESVLIRVIQQPPVFTWTLYKSPSHLCLFLQFNKDGRAALSLRDISPIAAPLGGPPTWLLRTPFP